MSKRGYLGLAALLAAAYIGMASPAGASTVFDFSYSALDGSFSGEGQFTTSGTSSPYLVSDVTGTALNGVAGSAITGISTYASADNLLYYPTQPYTDFFGISFSTASDGDFNLYFNNVEFFGYGFITQSLDPGGTGSGTEVLLNVSEVPLPASLLLFVTGLAAILLLAWRPGWAVRRGFSAA